MLQNYSSLSKSSPRLIVAAFLVGVMCPHSSFASPANDLIEAQQAFENGNSSKSFQLALKAARAGHVPAFVAVGTHYIMGLGTEKNLTKAIFWLRKAAEAGDAFGQYQLAIAYAKGEGVAKDLGMAFRLAQLSAEANHPEAESLFANIKNELGPNGVICVNYGLSPLTPSYSQCVMQLAQAQQQAQFAQQQYELQLAQYQQQLAAYEAQQAAIKKEKERRKWDMLARLGAGMANSSSPSFLGALNEGLAAANGVTLAPPSPPPPPMLPQDFTLRLSDGSRASCSYDQTFREVRCR